MSVLLMSNVSLCWQLLKKRCWWYWCIQIRKPGSDTTVIYLSKSLHVVAYNLWVGALQLFNYFKALVKLGKDIHHWAGEKSVFWCLLVLWTEIKRRVSGRGKVVEVLQTDSRRVAGIWHYWLWHNVFSSDWLANRKQVKNEPKYCLILLFLPLLIIFAIRPSIHPSRPA